MKTVAFIRNTCDIDDAYYDEEMRYINSVLPKLAVEMNALYRAILESSYRKEFQEEFGQVTLQKMEAAIPNAGLAVIPGTGHFSFVENPVLFGRIMASYFGLE